MSFLETPIFPVEIAYWAVGGGGWKTTIVQTYGGNEYRNQAWSQELGEWTFDEALRSQNPGSAYYYTALRNFYKVLRGRFNGFRFRDPLDHADEAGGVLGTTGLAVAATVAYQMYKNYSAGALTYQRKIVKPTVGATQIYNNGVLQLLGVNYNVDESTGIVTFTVQPTIGHTLTWTGSFEVPARFDFDSPQLGPESSGALLDWQSVRVVELRNWQ